MACKGIWAACLLVVAGCGSRAAGSHAQGNDAAVERTPAAPEINDAPPGPAADAMDMAAPDAGQEVAAVEAHEVAEVADASDTGGVLAPTPYRSLAVSVGRYHTCALLDDHRVKCWGSNTVGQLGLGDAKEHGNGAAEMGDALPFVDLGTGRTAKAISAGNYATCAILDTDDLKCWGMAERTTLPADTDAHQNRGDDPGEMGDALPAVNLGAGRKAKRVAVGYYGVCAQRDDDSFLCWPSASSPNVHPARAGHVVADLQASDRGAVALYDDGVAVEESVGGVLDFGPQAHPIAVAAGFKGSCAALQAGGVSCIGFHLPTSAPAPTAIFGALSLSELGDLFVLRGDGRVSGWPYTASRAWSDGLAPDGSFLVALGQPARALAGGGAVHSCALLADGGIKCWPSSSANVESIDLGTHAPR